MEIPMTPHAHIPNRITGSGSEGSGAVANTGDETVGTVKGWLNCSITTDTPGAIAGAVRHPIRLPIPTSKENGARNFKDAATHTQ